MNMNDKEWNRDSEFWDNQDDEDDDEDYNDVGDDIDANNDETFDNAAEWNEDEHEELIARDSILSHTIRSNSHVSSSNSNNNNNNRSNHNNNNRLNETSSINNNHHYHHRNNNTNVINNTSSNNSNVVRNQSNNSGYILNVIGSASRSGWNKIDDKDYFPNSSPQERLHDQSTSSVRWQNTSDRLQRHQLQQQQLLLQRKILEQEHQQKQQQLLLERQILQQRREEVPHCQLEREEFDRPQLDSSRQILRVDELERQLLKTRINNETPLAPPTNATDPPKRIGWSPFGGKDLFTNPESNAELVAEAKKILMQSNLPHSLTLEQQQQLLLQQHQILQHQHQIQQMAIMKQQQIQQEQRLMAQNPQCFTVEELERQMVGNRSISTQAQSSKPEPRNIEYCFLAQAASSSTKTNENQQDHTNSVSDRRETERFEKYDLFDRDERDSRAHRGRRENRNHRDQRDSHRDHRKRITIIPPQVQLSVIDQAKRLHPITAMHSDEFLLDRLPTAKQGFLFKRHSTVMEEKVNHDGVLTEKERSWLTKIQEKIQADYDDNLDQDYYYLLYFNRFSMTDEAAQKPSGPGVLDRRFIPRERLLYNSNT